MSNNKPVIKAFPDKAHTAIEVSEGVCMIGLGYDFSPLVLDFTP